ncbi:DUF6701 domain-containing protein [Marinimicrobium alkaliphilum]|uniref:DUF6701 domain-containing protein n=1 Tax=Marinimicrobium alkaliphilum TaxID=2202654 RepID=UPI00130073CE|nr:DUF6701 domain-containing protein [Marinimicrobium alkaliphilum]
MRVANSFVLIACLLLMSMAGKAQSGTVYNLSLGQFPQCSGTWAVEGSVYICAGNNNVSVTLNSGDTVIANEPSEISAAGGFTLNGANVGTDSTPVSLYSSNGNFNIGDSTVYGDLRASDNNNFSMNINRSLICGDIIGRNQTNLQLNDSQVCGDIVAGNGADIILNGSSVDGSITAQNSSTVDLRNNSTVGGNIAVGGGNSDIVIDESSSVTGVCTENTVLVEECGGSSTTHHYELLVPSSSVACLATPVSVRACANDTFPCASLDTSVAGETVTLTAFNGDSITLAFGGNGVASGSFSYPQAGEGELAEVVITGVSASPVEGLYCCPDGVDCLQSASCSSVFSTAGLVFTRSDNADQQALPGQVAGVPADVNLRAVRTNTLTGACEARVSGTRTVALGYECLNPAVCDSSQSLELAGSLVAGNSGGSVSNLTSVALTFDANGIAPLTLHYSDVGRIGLHAQLSLPEDPPDPAIDLLGASHSFVVRPHTLVIANDPGSEMLAGMPFRVEVEARNAQGEVTPSFGREQPSAAVALGLDIDSVAYPPSDPQMGFLGDADAGSFTSASAPGRAVNDEVFWSEVGDLDVVPRLNNYLGEAPPPVETVTRLGRFFPAYFEVISTVDPLVTDCACAEDDQQYMDQGLPIEVIVEARSALDVPVRNYDQSRAFGGLASVRFEAENAGEGLPLGDRISALDGVEWVDGERRYEANRWLFERLPSSTQPDGPYSALQLGIGLAHTNAEGTLRNRTMNSEEGGDCVATESCTAVAVGEVLDMRHGRLRVVSAYGPEQLDLPVPLVTEYWDGTGFVRHRNDDCTAVPRAQVTFAGESIDTAANLTVAVGSSVTQGSFRFTDLASSSAICFTGGSAGLQFSAPGEGGAGSFPVGVNLSGQPWLRFDWSGDGDWDMNVPGATVSFGYYRGHDRVIYWREVLE